MARWRFHRQSCLYATCYPVWFVQLTSMHDMCACMMCMHEVHACVDCICMHVHCMHGMKHGMVHAWQTCTFMAWLLDCMHAGMKNTHAWHGPVHASHDVCVNHLEITWGLPSDPQVSCVGLGFEDNNTLFKPLSTIVAQKTLDEVAEQPKKNMWAAIGWKLVLTKKNSNTFFLRDPIRAENFETSRNFVVHFFVYRTEVQVFFTGHSFSNDLSIKFKSSPKKCVA